MNADLKGLISAILNDFVDARFQTDVAAAELAEHYRTHPSMRALNVPSLNVSSVSVDLRFVFAPEEPEDGETGPARLEPSDVARELAESLRASIGLRPPLSGSPLGDAGGSRLEAALAAKLPETLAAAHALPTPARHAVLERLVSGAIAEVGAGELSPADARSVREIVASANARIGAADRAGRATRPRVLTAPDVLSAVNPEAISRISFTIDLDPRRWQETVDPGLDEEVTDVLGSE